MKNLFTATALFALALNFGCATPKNMNTTHNKHTAYRADPNLPPVAAGPGMSQGGQKISWGDNLAPY